ncbi:MAG: adenosylcobinamide amidohydrolase [Bryobacter sp.]|jgi:adenosylcobinamide amidohydrolase|nr:adenosylcobinamide amidohydrolase [Bryobacter sp. CoA8 C33]
MRLFLPVLLLAHCAGAQNTLVDTALFSASRQGRYFVVQLNKPHRVVSTSGRVGGLSETVTHLVNHQSMEARMHMERHNLIARMSEEEYHDLVARELNLDPARTAIMGTAANMNYLGRRSFEFRGLRVDAFVTAGVEGNATRPGDPAQWYEGEKGMEYIKPVSGTINTILLLNVPLTPAALERASVTMAEAKTSALLELGVASRYSSHLATGTGTDQFIIASPVDPAARQIRWAGPHTKLGELIGNAVREATVEALRWQNGMERSHTRSIPHALSRFGLTEEKLLARLEQKLPPVYFQLLKENKMALLWEPRVAAAAFAYAAVLDRLQYGTLPAEGAGETLRDQAASAGVAIAGKPESWARFWAKIRYEPTDKVGPFIEGLALGWIDRWPEAGIDAAPAAKR